MSIIDSITHTGKYHNRLNNQLTYDHDHFFFEHLIHLRNKNFRNLLFDLIILIL